MASERVRTTARLAKNILSLGAKALAGSSLESVQELWGTALEARKKLVEDLENLSATDIAPEDLSAAYENTLQNKKNLHYYTSVQCAIEQVTRAQIHMVDLVVSCFLVPQVQVFIMESRQTPMVADQRQNVLNILLMMQTLFNNVRQPLRMVVQKQKFAGVIVQVWLRLLCRPQWSPRSHMDSAPSFVRTLDEVDIGHINDQLERLSSFASQCSSSMVYDSHAALESHPLHGEFVTVLSFWVREMTVPLRHALGGECQASGQQERKTRKLKNVVLMESRNGTALFSKTESPKSVSRRVAVLRDDKGAGGEASTEALFGNGEEERKEQGVSVVEDHDNRDKISKQSEQTNGGGHGDAMRQNRQQPVVQAGVEAESDAKGVQESCHDQRGKRNPPHLFNLDEIQENITRMLMESSPVDYSFFSPTSPGRQSQAYAIMANIEVQEG